MNRNDREVASQSQVNHVISHGNTQSEKAARIDVEIEGSIAYGERVDIYRQFANGRKCWRKITSINVRLLSEGVHIFQQA